MLLSSSATIGKTLLACDGEIGTISDLLFDEESWSIARLLVLPGSRTFGRELLVDWCHLQGARPGTSVLPIALVRDQLYTSTEGCSFDDEKPTRLRSFCAARARDVRGRDNSLGHIDDLIVETRTGEVQFVVIGTTGWWPEREILLTPGWFPPTAWTGRTVELDLTRDQARAAPEYDPVGAST